MSFYQNPVKYCNLHLNTIRNTALTRIVSPLKQTELKWTELTSMKHHCYQHKSGNNTCNYLINHLCLLQYIHTSMVWLYIPLHKICNVNCPLIELYKGEPAHYNRWGICKSGHNYVKSKTKHNY